MTPRWSVARLSGGPSTAASPASMAGEGGEHRVNGRGGRADDASVRPVGEARRAVALADEVVALRGELSRHVGAGVGEGGRVAGDDTAPDVHRPADAAGVEDAAAAGSGVVADGAARDRKRPEVVEDAASRVAEAAGG